MFLGLGRQVLTRDNSNNKYNSSRDSANRQLQTLEKQLLWGQQVLLINSIRLYLCRPHYHKPNNNTISINRSFRLLARTLALNHQMLALIMLNNKITNLINRMLEDSKRPQRPWMARSLKLLLNNQLLLKQPKVLLLLETLETEWLFWMINLQQEEFIIKISNNNTQRYKESQFLLSPLQAMLLWWNHKYHKTITWVFQQVWALQLHRIKTWVDVPRILQDRSPILVDQEDQMPQKITMILNLSVI